jgi:hypothetical protein
MNTFFDFFWLMFLAFLWIAWIVLVVRVLVDVFRSDSSGWAKAGWALFIMVLPFVGVLVYLIAEGSNLARREAAGAFAIEQAQRDYIRSAAGSNGGRASDLEKAAELRDRGVLTDEEFRAYKLKMLV